MLDEREAVDTMLHDAKNQWYVHWKEEFLTRPGKSPHSRAGESPDC